MAMKMEEISRRDAVKAIGMAAASVPFFASRLALAADDDYSHGRKKKKSQCDDGESSSGSESVDDGATTAPAGYGDWATEGTASNRNMKLIFKTMTENYGMSGAAAVAIIANSIREVGGTFDPCVGENGARFDNVNDPYPSSGAGGVNGIYDGGANGGGGLWQFTPYEKFSLSEWFKGSKAVNKSAGWSVENEAAFLVEKELNNPGEYETFLTFRYHMYKGDEPNGYRTSSYPGGTVYGVSHCDEGRVETKPVKPPTYMTLMDFCKATDPVAAATDFYYANEGGWRYDACVPGTTLHFGGRPVNYPGIECYIPMLTKILNTPAVAANPSKLGWVNGSGGGGGAIVDTSSDGSSSDDDECLEEECEQLQKLEAGDRLVETAKTQVGIPYLLGGNEWGKLLDCSGLVYWSMHQLGVAPVGYRTAWNQRVYCEEHNVIYPLDQRIPGDLLFFPNPGGTHTDAPVSHVGIYCGKDESGQDMIVEEVLAGCVYRPIDFNARSIYKNEVGRIMAASPVAQMLGSKTSTEKKCDVSYLDAGMTELRQKAVDTALGMVGKEYKRYVKYDDSGYTGTDCNGLTYYCWNTVCGVNLAYPSGSNCYGQYQQLSATSGWKTRVEDLVPGDVVFFQTRLASHHVALYIGNGEIVQAQWYGIGIIRSSIAAGGTFQGGACPEGLV